MKRKQVITPSTNRPRTKKRSPSILSRLLKLASLVILLALCGFVYLRTSCSARRRLFAWILTQRNVTEMSDFSKQLVCPSIQNGYDTVQANEVNPIVVADVGTGAGASLICHAQQIHRIKKLYLIEPNTEFTSELERVVNHFKFPAGMVEIIAQGGEDASETVPTGGVDLVTTVHLLCSVDAEVLAQVTGSISRILTSGGAYIGIDHTKTRLDKSIEEIPGPVPVFPFSVPIVMRVVQTIVEPVWETIANGCKFVDMPELYAAHFGEQSGFRGSPALRELRYPVMKYIPLVWDHVVGVSRKA